MSVTPIKEIIVMKEVRQLACGQRIPGAIRYPLPRSRARLQSEVAFKAQLRRQLGDSALWDWNTAL